LKKESSAVRNASKANRINQCSSDLWWVG